MWIRSGACEDPSLQSPRNCYIRLLGAVNSAVEAFPSLPFFSKIYFSNNTTCFTTIMPMALAGLASGSSAESAVVLSAAKRSKPRRVLACTVCQQRKLRCDRKQPCSNCTKLRLQCIPATQVTARKRRFPERELLERLRNYEKLLRKNNVAFEPLHKNPALEKKLSNVGVDSDSDDEGPKAADANSSPSSIAKPGRANDSK